MSVINCIFLIPYFNAFVNTVLMYYYDRVFDLRIVDKIEFENIMHFS